MNKYLHFVNIFYHRKSPTFVDHRRGQPQNGNVVGMRRPIIVSVPEAHVHHVLLSYGAVRSRRGVVALIFFASLVLPQTSHSTKGHKKYKKNEGSVKCTL